MPQLLSEAALVLKLCLPQLYAHPAVKYTVTQPGLSSGRVDCLRRRVYYLFYNDAGDAACLHSSWLKEWAGRLLGALLAVFVLVETPYSGMSLNPARTLGTAVPAGRYHGLWLYWVAPSLAMWIATVGFLRFHHGQPLECAILAGCGPSPSSPQASDEEPPQYPDE